MFLVLVRAGVVCKSLSFLFWSIYIFFKKNSSLFLPIELRI